MNDTRRFSQWNDPPWWENPYKEVVEKTPVTGNDKVPDEKLRTNDLSGLSIPARPGQGAKL
jgi:hypothetical protein